MVPVYIVVTEYYYGGKDDVGIFSDKQKAEFYRDSLVRKYNDKVDVIILERTLT